eukprot:GDKJ01022121.1.p1 GENE.GDKJ01022121.1~~GDKJ01022121.1.p1  ORF type:complete len:972 (+),score=212.66 GDKJ01022121.1:42-2918(+)
MKLKDVFSSDLKFRENSCVWRYLLSMPKVSMKDNALAYRSFPKISSKRSFNSWIVAFLQCFFSLLSFGMIAVAVAFKVDQNTPFMWILYLGAILTFCLSLLKSLTMHYYCSLNGPIDTRGFFPSIGRLSPPFLIFTMLDNILNPLVMLLWLYIPNSNAQFWLFVYCFVMWGFSCLVLFPLAMFFAKHSLKSMDPGLLPFSNLKNSFPKNTNLISSAVNDTPMKGARHEYDSQILDLSDIPFRSYTDYMSYRQKFSLQKEESAKKTMIPPPSAPVTDLPMDAANFSFETDFLPSPSSSSCSSSSSLGVGDSRRNLNVMIDAIDEVACPSSLSSSSSSSSHSGSSSPSSESSSHSNDEDAQSDSQENDATTSNENTSAFHSQSLSIDSQSLDQSHQSNKPKKISKNSKKSKDKLKHSSSSYASQDSSSSSSSVQKSVSRSSHRHHRHKQSQKRKKDQRRKGFAKKRVVSARFRRNKRWLRSAQASLIMKFLYILRNLFADCLIYLKKLSSSQISFWIVTSWTTITICLILFLVALHHSIASLDVYRHDLKNVGRLETMVSALLCSSMQSVVNGFILKPTLSEDEQLNRFREMADMLKSVADSALLTQSVTDKSSFVSMRWPGREAILFGYETSVGEQILDGGESLDSPGLPGVFDTVVEVQDSNKKKSISTKTPSDPFYSNMFNYPARVDLSPSRNRVTDESMQQSTVQGLQKFQSSDAVSISRQPSGKVISFSSVTFFKDVRVLSNGLYYGIDFLATQAKAIAKVGGHIMKSRHLSPIPSHVSVPPDPSVSSLPPLKHDDPESLWWVLWTLDHIILKEQNLKANFIEEADAVHADFWKSLIPYIVVGVILLGGIFISTVWMRKITQKSLEKTLLLSKIIMASRKDNKSQAESLNQEDYEKFDMAFWKNEIAHRHMVLLHLIHVCIGIQTDEAKDIIRSFNLNPPIQKNENESKQTKNTK